MDKSALNKYLDKYKDKSKKSKKFVGTGLKIVDSDTSLIPTYRHKTSEKRRRRGIDDDDDGPDSRMDDPEEMPQIADFIDERPNEIKLLEQFGEGSKWKTLDGKKAGLQTAGALKMELEVLQKLENERFQQMEDSVTGRYAKTKVRDRRTGRERDFAAENEEKQEENRKAAERKQQYDKWGKGMKQVEEQQERVSAALHEMAKPLARYKDDEDLDAHLRQVDREGDPMLKFLTKKKTSRFGGPAKPAYNGPPPPPNRFNIQPGYRWDGVDRSIGYEKQWFERANSRKAFQEESYKWSVEDL